MKYYIHKEENLKIWSKQILRIKTYIIPVIAP